MEHGTFGTVFTKRWVVDFMLNLCGYVESKDLAGVIAVEPSCGDGAFLLPMVERLSRSLRAFGRPLSDAEGAIRAFDLQRHHVAACRVRIVDALVSDGWDEAEARSVATLWVNHEDYLLSQPLEQVDFVIGNPPYIRSEELGPGQRADYVQRWDCMTVGSDIFVGFIEAGLLSLRDGGLLCLIVADRWMHNTYGRKLRRLVVRGFSVDAVIEMHGVDAFSEQVSAYPAVTLVRRGAQGPARYAIAQHTLDETAAMTLWQWLQSPSAGQDTVSTDAGFVAAVLPEWFETDDVWPSASPARLAVLERLNHSFRSLQDVCTGTKIGIGVATGADSVFVVEDSRVAEPDRLLPLVLTKHTRSGRVNWQGTWLVNPWDEEGNLIDIALYPRMGEYLVAHTRQLRNRHTAQKSSSAAWYRTIDKVQPGLAAKPKLLLPDMKATIQPVLEDEGLYPHHNLYWVTSDVWDLRVLGGLLLSRVAEMFVRAYGVKMRGGTLRFQSQYLRLIRVPDPKTLSPVLMRELAQAFEMRDADAATAAALKAYDLEELPD